MNLDDFLASHYNADSEPGAFTLNPVRAKEQIVESLRFEAWGFPRHLLAAAFLGGATSLEGGTPGQFSLGVDKFLKERRAPEYIFQCDCSSLDPEDLKNFDQWLLQPEERFQYRLALTFHQMQTLNLKKFYFESWHGSTYHRLTVSEDQQILTTHKKAVWEKSFQGIRLFLWEQSQGRPWSRKANPAEDERRTGLKEAALWSPVRVTLNHKILNQNCHPSRDLVSEYWENPARPLPFVDEVSKSRGEYSMLAMIHRQSLGSRFYPVVEGVTLKPQALPFLKRPHLELPGLRLVIHSTQFKSDASELALVEEQNSALLLENAERIVKNLRCKLFDPTHQDNRKYLLRHWHSLNDRSLRELPLFELKSGQRTSVSQMRRWQEAQTLDIERDLQYQDAQYARVLLPPLEAYAFRRGYAEPSTVKLSSCGQWVALAGKRYCQIVPTEGHKDIQTLHCELGVDTLAWHPKQPWLAIRQELQVMIWDVTKQTVLHKLSAGEYDAIFFSRDGAWLQVLLLDGPSDSFSLQRWSSKNWELQKPTHECPGFSRVFGQHIVVWEGVDRLSIRHFDSPNEVLVTFEMPDLIWQILDVSPDQNCVAFQDRHESVYLLDLLRQSFDPLPIRPNSLVFSWDSNYLFYRDDEGCRAYHLESHVSRVGWHYGHRVLRSGLALTCSDVGGQVAITKSNQLLSLAQPPPFGGRDSIAAVIGPKDNRRAVLFQRDSCRILWHCAPTTLFALTDSYLAWSSSDGVNVLSFEKKEVTFLEGHGLQGRLVLRSPSSEFQGLVKPSHGTATPFDLQIKRYEGVIILDLTTGKEVPSDGALATDCNGQYAIACPHQNHDVQHFHYRHLDKNHSWIGDFPEGSHGSLHPTDSLLLLSTSLTTQVLRLRPEGYVPLKSKLPGHHAQYSPSGDFFALACAHGLDIYQSQNLLFLGSLNMGTAQLPDWHWLSDQCLQIGSSLYRACSARGWKQPGETYGSVPPHLHSRKDSEVGIVQTDGEIHFYSLLNGQRVGVLHPMGREWFFTNFKGQWEVSGHALRWVKPQPTEPATPGILAALFEA